jgi:hypothetical protein
LITTELGVATTLTTFVAVFATTAENLKFTSDLLREVDGAEPVTFSINALRNSCSAMPVLDSVVHSAPVEPSVRPSTFAFTETFALVPSIGWISTVIV